MGVSWKLADLEKGVQQLQAAGITEIEEYPFDRDFDYYNCWGLTTHLLGWIPETDLTWLDREIMVELLNNRSEPVPKSHTQEGDIVVFGDELCYFNEYGNISFEHGALQHTAILVDVDKQKTSDRWCYIHKPGAYPPEIQTLDGCASWHDYCQPDMIREFRRRLY